MLMVIWPDLRKEVLISSISRVAMVGSAEIEIDEACPENGNRRQFPALGNLSFFACILPSFGCRLFGFFLIRSLLPCHHPSIS